MRYFLFLILFFTVGCSGTPTDVAMSPKPQPSVARKAAVKQVEATFDTVLASNDSARFQFTTAEGESVVVDISKDKLEAVKVDPQLLDPEGDPEMLYAANLEWFGKTVVLHYDEDGNVEEISGKGH